MSYRLFRSSLIKHRIPRHQLLDQPMNVGQNARLDLGMDKFAAQVDLKRCSWPYRDQTTDYHVAKEKSHDGCSFIFLHVIHKLRHRHAQGSKYLRAKERHGKSCHLSIADQRSKSSEMSWRIILLRSYLQARQPVL
eukprot:766789-Hanusia_phi.AAC.3